MNKSIILAIALVAILMVACSRVEKTPVENVNGNAQQNLVTQDTTSDANQFVDSQFVDPNEEIEIGSII